MKLVKSSFQILEQSPNIENAVKVRFDAEIKYFGEYKSEIKCV